MRSPSASAQLDGGVGGATDGGGGNGGPAAEPPLNGFWSERLGEAELGVSYLLGKIIKLIVIFWNWWDWIDKYNSNDP